MATFNGKRALVTGAGRGIGRVVAMALAENGVKVFALSRTKSTLETLQAEKPTIETICVDVADWQATRQALSQLDPVDMLVNSAGTLFFHSLLDVSEEDVNKMFDVNLKAVINISQMVCKGMIDGGRTGSVVNLSSVSGSRHSEKMALYSIAKAGIEMLTRSMAREFGPHGIRVNSVAPGIVMTDMGKQFPPERIQRYENFTSLKRLPKVEECVDMILFLLSDKAGGTTGSNIGIDCGALV